MKNFIKIGFLALMSALAMVACDPMEDNGYSLGSVPKTSDLSFTAAPSASKPNIIEFTNTSKVSGVAVWDFGNSSSGKGTNAKSSYPYAGTYTVTMTLYTSGGSTSVTKEVVIANNDFSLLNTPLYNALTGGSANIAGKTWVFDQYNTGHFGVGPKDDTSPSWWQCPAEGKAGSSLYTQEFTFSLDGLKLKWTNNGYIYTNQAGVNSLGISDIVSNPGGAGDFDVKYTPASNLTFSINESAKTIKLSGGAFFGHYAGTSEYQILKLTDDVLYLKCISTVEPGNGWWYRLVPKEKNVKPEVPLKAKPLSENFEMAIPSVLFTTQAMGSATNASYGNPWPLGANTSSKVYLYNKSSDFYSNIYFAASNYKFNLTEQHIIKLKVFIPSYNDYTTDNSVAGDWITNKKLLPQVAVKLQNGDLGDNAWSTQTEIVKGNLPQNQWIDLTFDFSSVKDRADYNKIVIQFGGEGHSGTGIFFFDNFQFTK